MKEVSKKDQACAKYRKLWVMKEVSKKDQACAKYRKLWKMRNRLNYLRGGARPNPYTLENLEKRCDKLLEEIHGLGFDEENLQDCLKEEE